MPVASKYDLDQILNVQTERKAEISWEDIIYQLNFYISSKILYLIAKKHRDDILTKLKSTESFRDNDNNEQKLNLNIELYKEQWEYIYDFVTHKIYKGADVKCFNQEYHSLKPWSSIIQSLFLELKLILENIKNEVENSNGGDHGNVKFNPRVAKTFFHFWELIPTWFFVIVPKFKYVKNSETPQDLFDYLKTKVFKHKTLPTRIDTFLKTLIISIFDSMNLKEYTLGELKPEIGCDNYLASEEKYEITKEKYSGDNFKTDSRIIYNTEKNDINSIGVILKNEKKHSYENWRRLRRETQTKNISLGDINKPNDEPNEINNCSKTKSTVTDLLKNGNSIGYEPIQIYGFNYTLSNTCAFDTLVQLICCSYIDSRQYSVYIDEELKLHDFFELVADAASNGISIQTYQKRFVILIKIMWSFQTWNLNSKLPRNFDCTCTVDFMIRKMFTNYPSLLTVEKCLNCSHIRNITNATISVNVDNLNFLDDILLSMSLQSPETCINCKTGSIEVTNEYGKQIFIELYHVPTTVEQNSNKNLDISLKLHEIPKTITVQEQLYNLRGVINFIPPLSKDLHAVGHYIGYCWRNATGEWVEYDDLATSSRIVGPNFIITNCQVLAYTI